MGAEQSQMSQVDAPTSQTQDEVFDPNNITSDSESEPKRKEAMNKQRQSTPPSEPPVHEIEGKTPKGNKRKARKKNRKKSRSSSVTKSVEDQFTTDDTPLNKGPVKSRISEDDELEDMRQEISGRDSDIGFDGTRDDDGESTIVVLAESERTKEDGITAMEPTLPATVQYPSLRVSSRSRSVSQSTNGKKRLKYPCPHADKYDCTETFALVSAAKRHAQTAHASSGRLRCPFCSLAFIKADRLQAHKLAKHASEMVVTEEGDEGTDGEEMVGGSVDLGEEDRIVNSDIEEEKLANQQGSQILPDMMQRPVHNENRMSDAEEDVNSKITDSESLQEVQDSEPQNLYGNDDHITGTENPEQSSSKSSMTQDSVFDVPAEPMLVDSTQKPAKRLKRKRNVVEGQTTSTPSIAPKRRRRDVLSPPTSITSEEATPTTNTETRQISTGTGKAPRNGKLISKPINGKSGNLDAFAQPWAPGSQLYHPIHNPRSPRKEVTQQVQVIIPRSSQAGPSTMPSKKLRNAAIYDLPNNEEHQTPLTSKIQKAVYSSPKGKRNAEPGVEYSSPEKRSQAIEADEQEEDISLPYDQDINVGEGGDDEEDADFHPTLKRDVDTKKTSQKGIATSVARRTSSQKSSRAAANSRKKRKTNADGNDESGSSVESSDNKENGSDGDLYLCQECKRKFRSRDALRKHEKTKGVHDKQHRCEDCGKTFTSIQAVVEHQKQTDHGDGTGYQGRKGHLSPGEVAKIDRWRDRFCDEYDLNTSDFNQMMTDSCRRTKGFIWPHRFIAKQDFMQEYYDVLPNRNRRSMYRYRERTFQNVPQNQTWTAEDDDELVRLYKQLGPKWVEIGQRMTRTQDSVNQRWRHKLQYHGKTVDGEWLPGDAEQLVKAVNLVKRESNQPLDPDADVRIPWELVSKKMKLKRTAQQCSNKWRAMHLAKKDGRYVIPKSTQPTPKMLSSSTTPSKMSRRLAGETPVKQPPTSTSMSSSAKRKYISEERAYDTDEDESHTRDEQAEKSDNVYPSAYLHQDEQQEQKIPVTRSKKSRKGKPILTSDEVADTPTLSRNPLLAKTPRNGVGLSQVFNQTQANTSAPRLTSTARKQTQTERPSPDIPMRLRPRSSPLDMISVRNPVEEEHSGSEADTDESNDRVDDRQGTDGEADEVEAEEEEEEEKEDDEEQDEVSEVADEESNTSESGMIEEEAVEAATSSEAESEAEESGGSESTSSSGETDDESASDREAQDMSKNTFFQSLQSQSTTNSAAVSKPTAKSRKIDWMKAVRGRMQQGASEEEESESSSDDAEGDIMHH